MEKFIEVYDDFFPQKLIDDIESTCLNDKSINFGYVNNISGPEAKTLPGMAHPFYLSKEKVYISHSYFNQILYQFCAKRNIIINEILNGRVFLTFPNLSKDPCNIHNDLQYPHWVCLYYINDADGDTVFYNNKKEEVKRISPKKGRIIFFNGNILHSGVMPTQYPRFIINFNFKGKFY